MKMKKVKVILAVCLWAISVLVPTLARSEQSITLAWSPSPDVTVVGYNLYCGAISTTTNKLDVGLSLTTTVSNLQVGVTYYFFATAYDAAGGESEPSNFITYTPTVTNYPDLIVTAVNFSPASPIEGNVVQFSAVIANVGMEALPVGSKIRVKFTVDGGTTIARAFFADGLLPGATANVMPKEGSIGFGTWTGVTGVHSVTAIVDDLGAVVETAETNNQLQVAMQVSPAPLPVISIAVDKTTVAEGDTNGVWVTVLRSGYSPGPLTIGWSLGGTATNGVDYELFPASFVIPAGDGNISFQLLPTRDGVVDEGKSVNLSLTPSADYQIGLAGVATISITNVDVELDGGGGEPVVPTQSVALAWSPSPDVTVVGYNLYYGAVSTTTTNKIDVGLALTATVSNLQVGVTYFFFATAYDAAGGESEPSSFIVYTPITNQPTPSVSLSLSVTQIGEGDSAGVVVTVARSDIGLNPLSIGLKAEGSAISGVDYIPMPVSVVIPPGTNAICFRLIPIPNETGNQTKSIILNLRPSSGYDVGLPSSGTVLLFDQDVDSDGDGMNDAAELLARTDVNDANSSLRILSLLPEHSGQLSLSWVSTAGVTYRVMNRDSLAQGDWNPASPPIMATNNITSWTFTPTNAADFFGLSVVAASVD